MCLCHSFCFLDLLCFANFYVAKDTKTSLRVHNSLLRHTARQRLQTLAVLLSAVISYPLTTASFCYLLFRKKASNHADSKIQVGQRFGLETSVLNVLRKCDVLRKWCFDLNKQKSNEMHLRLFIISFSPIYMFRPAPAILRVVL